ncbi:hypothetical protein [Halomonas sp. A29]|uniref:hypothetical protein n=1 Tax=Halomonas sp. A29 TaxID=3102786 RepID=UPI00398AEC3D
MQRLLLTVLAALLVGLPISASQAVEDGLHTPSKALAELTHLDTSLSLSSLDADSEDVGPVPFVTFGHWAPTCASGVLASSALACRQVTLPPARAPPHYL